MKRDLSQLDVRDRRKPVPFAFVLDALDALELSTRPMFGCTAIYHGATCLLILRDKGDADSGVWVGTQREHHASLRAELPSLRDIAIFGEGPTKWQNLPADAEGFEDEVLAVCAMVLRGDPRIGVIPKARKKRAVARR